MWTTWLLPLWLTASDTCQTLPTPLDTVALRFERKTDCYYENPRYAEEHPREWYKAAGSVLAWNAGVQLMDRFMLRLDYANISMHSISENFRRGWVWDNDNFIINQIGHPYQGSLYYNAARVCGLNYYESLPYCFLGSFTWEMFCETDPPAINDLITTPLGGAAIGEICWRLSDLVLDDSKRGWRRFWREALSSCINPVRGLNRIVSGEAWRHRTSYHRYHLNEEFPVHFSVGIGGRHLSKDFDMANATANMQFTFRLLYGNEISAEDVRPYDFFTLNVETGVFGNQPFVQQVNLMGRIYGHLFEWKSGWDLQAGIYQHFNFYNSRDIEGGGDDVYAPFQISETASFGPGFILRRCDHKGFFHFEQHLHLCGVALGATKSDFYHVLDRTYNMGSGYSVKSSTLHRWGDRFILALHLQHYHLITWRDYDVTYVEEGKDLHYLNAPGAKCHSMMDVAQGSFIYHLRPHLSFIIEPTYYLRHTHYHRHENITYRTFEISTSLQYTL